MKTSVFAIVAAMLASASAATAADLPRRNAAPAASFTSAPLFTWTGVYAGVNVGYGFGAFTGAGGNFQDPSGIIAGGQLGYNYQMGNLVLGVEGDYQYSDLKGGPSVGGVAGSKAEVQSFGTVRARLGYAVDRFLPYITGGYAVGDTKVSIPALGKKDAYAGGYVLGAGAEYAFTNNITGKLEGLYINLEDKRYLTTSKVGSEFGVLRAGVNVKF